MDMYSSFIGNIWMRWRVSETKLNEREKLLKHHTKKLHVNKSAGVYLMDKLTHKLPTMFK